MHPRIINVTPHPLIFHDGTNTWSVGTSDWVIRARVEYQDVRQEDGVAYAVRVCQPEPSGWQMIQQIRERYGSDVVIVGSYYCAEAYPGDVVAGIRVAASRMGEICFHPTRFLSHERNGVNA